MSCPAEKLGLELIISSAEIKEDVSLLLLFLMCSMNSFLPWVKHLRQVLPAIHHFSDYLPAVNSSSSFSFEPVTSMELETEILLLPTNKSHGLYSSPAISIYLFIYLPNFNIDVFC